jgi:heptaprenyl diphosphate synthase
MWILRKILSEKYIWICSILGAVAHNMGQIFAAIIVTKTIYVISYLPVLMIAGIIAGAFTGIVAQIVVKRLRSFTIKKYNYN